MDELSLEAPDMVVVMVVMMMVVVMLVVVEEIVLLDQAFNIAELLNATRYVDGPTVIEAVFFLSLLQELHEKRMVDVDHRYDEPLLLFSFMTHHHSHTPLRYTGLIFLHGLLGRLLLILIVMVMMMQMQMKTQKMLISTTHQNKLLIDR